MSAEGVPASGQEDSVRNDLLAAMSQLKERDSQGSVETSGEGGGGGEAPLAETGATGAQPRDAGGKFAAKAPEGEGAPDVGAAPATPAAQAVKAPDGWTAEMKAEFAALPPKVQAEISRRESELTRKISSADDERTFGRKIKEAAQPYEAVIASEGSTVDAAFKSFLNYNYVMRQGTPQQKVQAILNVARIFNVPLQQALQQPQQGNVYQHPAIESLEQRLNRMEQAGQTAEQNRKLQEDAENQAEIDRFAADPSHSHFDTVKAHMGALLSVGVAKSLQDAYDQACYAHPDIRSALTTAQAAAAQREQIAKAEAAKKAAGSVTGGPGGARPPAPPPSSTGSIRDDIKAAMAQVQAGRI